MSTFRKCTTPGAIYEFSIAGNVFSAKVTLPTLRYLKVTPEEFDQAFHDALEAVINQVSADSGQISSSRWERYGARLEDDGNE